GSAIAERSPAAGSPRDPPGHGAALPPGLPPARKARNPLLRPAGPGRPEGNRHAGPIAAPRGAEFLPRPDRADPADPPAHGRQRPVHRAPRPPAGSGTGAAAGNRARPAPGGARCPPADPPARCPPRPPPAAGSPRQETPPSRPVRWRRDSAARHGHPAAGPPTTDRAPHRRRSPPDGHTHW